MAIVVARIVHRLDVGEAHTADDENAEQRRHDKDLNRTVAKLLETLS